MKEIKLTRGQVAIVDDWNYDFLMQWKWFAMWNPCTKSFYATRREGKNPQRAVLMHRVIMKTPDGMQCDHIHHNTLDNRESELRNVTRPQNMMNKSLQKNNELGVRGIRYRKQYGGYCARLMCNGKTVLNKTFPTLEEAIQARLQAENEYFGEYAYGAS